jgi:outer membrane receptor protein involved in Fe transport
MRLGERGAIVSGPSSHAMSPGSHGSADRNGNAIFTGDGWDTNTFSIFSEANLTLKPWLKVLLSGRVDKNTYSDWLFSPRIALISNIADGHYLKLIAQRSMRMNTAGQNYADHKNGHSPQDESLNGVELIYSAFPSDRISLSLASFWNDLEVIAWNEDNQSTDSVGDLQLFGIETELDYRWSFGKVGFNYSWVKQLDWDLAGGVPQSGISYADYDQALKDTDAVQKGVGNDLNNWPNHALKLFGRMTLFDRVTLHVDARFLWDFQGSKDGLTGLRRAVAGLPEEAEVARSLRRLKDVGTYEYDFRLNASVSYKLLEGLDVQVFGQNLLGANRNKRYSYDFNGNNRASPHRVRFIEEPRVYGVRIDYQF